MSVFDSINNSASTVLDTSKTYVEVSEKYFKLKIFQQLTRTFSYLSKLAIIGSLLFLGFIFLLVASVLWLGEILESYSLSCLLVATFLFIMTGISYLLRKSIDKKVIKKIGKEFFD
ncbi:phage holin family protein [Aquimarina litoralis]|uniref:Holin-X, holin superfamily III n=1 Tax=Aquimarina litoralis TaxID=584605 RepID=A0ABN1IKK4_9FLAO|nr:phage holin family protein [uncultured Aquimarina sp.]